MRPGQTAARLHRTRGRIRAPGLVVCPLISGLFFGIISASLLLPSGGIEHATLVGVLVGGFMFTSNAVALCIAQSAANRDGAPREQPGSHDIGEARAS